MRFAYLPFFALASVVACSAGSSEVAESSEDAIVGITDLGALETELGLVKDSQNAGGAWARPDGKLQAGRCYKTTLGSAHASRFELRRYTKGAAFFSKRSAGGDLRPITCVDVDVDTSVDGDPATLSLSGVALDAAIRYHLGKPLGAEGAAGHTYVDFEHESMVEIGDSGHYCGFFGESGAHTPGSDAYAVALTSCKQSGGNDDACTEKAMAACEKAVDKDILADTIDRPAFDAIDTYAAGYFYGIQVARGPKDGPSYANVDGMVAAAAYRYAYKTAASHSAFTLAGDPVGKFLSAETQYSDNDPTTFTQHVHFEKLDAHHTKASGIERLMITPKNADPSAVASALVLCTRSVGFEGEATASFQCRGL